jgi:hypothetical protein
MLQCEQPPHTALLCTWGRVGAGAGDFHTPPGEYSIEAPPTQGTLSEDPFGCSFEDSPGLCSKRPRESVRVPLLARHGPVQEFTAEATTTLR